MKAVRYCLIGAAALAAAVLGTGLVVYASNRTTLNRLYPVTSVPIVAASGADAVQRGRHLADIVGCIDCHGADLRGRLFDDEGWMRGRYYASNLTLKATRYSDEDIARILRVGVRPDGRGVLAMPSFGFVRLTDGEVADIIAFIRTRPVGGDEQPAHHLGPIDQWKLWRGEGPKIAISYVESERAKRPVEVGAQHETGRHLAGIVCAECHGGDLTGNGWDSGASDLAVVRSYSRPQFERLLRTGKAVGDRTLGLMTKIAQDRLHKLFDSEIDAIYAYLVARAELPAR